ncbi:hypothetical protein ACWCRD_02855 [Streptomyces sp. NPDC002092]
MTSNPDDAPDDQAPAATPQPAVQVDDFAREFGDSLEWVTDVND